MTIFEIGWNHGLITQRECTAREAMERFPGFNSQQIDEYLNGRGDGVRGDSFRIVLIRQQNAATCGRAW